MCFKSDKNPTTINLILTDRSRCFSNTLTTETGIFDFHLMVSIVLNSGFTKRGPKIIHYHDYSKFYPSVFRSDLREELSKCHRDRTTFDHCNVKIEQVLNKHAALKKKSVRANDGPFMTKALRKAIMLRIKLRNIHNKCRTRDKWNAYKKQRNKCVKILRQAKLDYYGNLDVKDISDNRKFWKTVKPLFSDKFQTPGNITLLEDDELVSGDEKIAKIIKDYFVNITAEVDIAEIEKHLIKINKSSEPVDVAIDMNKSHPSIHLSRQKIEKEINSLSNKFPWRR